MSAVAYIGGKPVEGDLSEITAQSFVFVPEPGTFNYWFLVGKDSMLYMCTVQGYVHVRTRSALHVCTMQKRHIIFEYTYQPIMFVGSLLTSLRSDTSILPEQKYNDDSAIDE